MIRGYGLLCLGAAMSRAKWHVRNDPGRRSGRAWAVLCAMRLDRKPARRVSCPDALTRSRKSRRGGPGDPPRNRRGRTAARCTSAGRVGNCVAHALAEQLLVGNQVAHPTGLPVTETTRSPGDRLPASRQVPHPCAARFARTVAGDRAERQGKMRKFMHRPGRGLACGREGQVTVLRAHLG